MSFNAMERHVEPHVELNAYMILNLSFGQIYGITKNVLPLQLFI